MFSGDRIRNLSVRNRIIGSIMILAFTLMVSVPLILSLQRTFLYHFDHVTEIDSKSNRLLLKAHAKVNLARLNLFRYLQDYLPSTYEALVEVQEAEKLINDALGLMTDFGPEINREINSVYPLFTRIETLIFEAQEAAIDGDRSEVVRLVFQASKTGADLGEHLSQIVIDSERHMEHVNSMVRKDARERVLMLLFGYVVTIISGVIFGSYIARSITIPVGELRNGAERFRQGKFDERIVVQGRDELSLLALTFNDMAKKLHASFTQLKNTKTSWKNWWRKEQES